MRLISLPLSKFGLGAVIQFTSKNWFNVKLLHCLSKLKVTADSSVIGNSATTATNVLAPHSDFSSRSQTVKGRYEYSV
jgi:hypothetical protein